MEVMRSMRYPQGSELARLLCPLSEDSAGFTTYGLRQERRTAENYSVLWQGNYSIYNYLSVFFFIMASTKPQLGDNHSV